MLSCQDIIDFVKEYSSKNGVLTDSDSIAVFIKELQDKMQQLDYSVPEGTVVIGYSGKSNTEDVWKIVKKICDKLEDGATYISDLPAGKLLSPTETVGIQFKSELTKLFDNDTEVVERVMGGYEKVYNSNTGLYEWKRTNNQYCGYGDDLVTLDDFVSSKLMGETVGASNNLIVFIPESVDHTKVFATTELECIFKNDTFQFINGIPKSELESIYRSGDVGKQSVYDIISKTSSEVVGTTSDIDAQAELLKNSFSENGKLNSNSSEFSISKCYDADGKLIGIELESSKSGVLIDRPDGTATTELVVKADIESVTDDVSFGADDNEMSGEDNTDTENNEDADNTNDSEEVKDSGEAENDEGKKDVADEGDDGNSINEEADNNEDVDDTNEGEDTKDSTDNSNESGNEGTDDNSDTTDNKESSSDSETSKESSETTSDSEGDKNSSDSSSGDEIQGTEDVNANDTDESDSNSNTSNDSDSTNANDTNNKADTRSNADTSSKKNTDTVVALPGGEETSDSKVPDTSQSDTGTNKTTDTTSGSSVSSDNGSSSSESTIFGSSSTNGGDTTSSASTSSDSSTNSSSNSNKGKTSKEELSDNGKKIVEAYENATGEKVDVDATPGVISKINKYADVIDKIGDGADLFDAGIAYATAIKQAASGDINGACKTLSDYGFSTLGGMGASALAVAILGMCSVNPLLGFAFICAMGYLGSELGEDFSDWWFREVLGLYDDAGAYTYPVDPLILDLDGDGIETISVEDGVNFDFDNNGFAEKTGWVGADDGLLVRDINGNGQIDNGGELFGDLTVAEDFTAENGFEALKYFDANEDNIINHLDAIYSELRVWKDANQNGKVDAGELYSLEELGIAGFDLDYEDINETDSSGNSHTQKSTYIKEDGSVAILEDVWFGKDASDTVVVDGTQEDLLEETEAVSGLPDIRGYGNQYSLHQAMLRDETGELQSLIEQYVATEDTVIRKSMIKNIIYVWTGVEDESSTGRGSNLSDSRKLEALEVITGRDFESAYGSNPVYQAGQYIEQAFNKLVEMYYAELERQTTYAELYQHLYANVDVDEEGNVFFDTEKVMEVLTEEYEQDSKSGRSLIIHFVNNMKKTGFISMINEDIFSEQLTVFGTDIIHEIKYAGDDNIVGSDYHDDKLNGELGDDTLQGGKGNDEYYFDLGDGQDTIIEKPGVKIHLQLESVSTGSGSGSSGSSGGGISSKSVLPEKNIDRIVFGEGITTEDIEVTRDSWNLYLTNKTSGDRIKVQDFFNSTGKQIEEIEFADGSKWSIDDLKDKARYYYGTEGNDTISGFNSYYNAPTLEDDYLYGGAGDDTLSGNNGSDELYGEDGNDTLNGGSGSDTLVGGTGNDTLSGGTDNDTYLFDLGDGQDTVMESKGTDRIVFGEGITTEDIEVTRDSWNLYLTNKTSGDRIKVQDFFNSTGKQIEEIVFADGSKWSIDDLKDKARYYYGTEGNDTISGFNSYYNAPTLEDDYLYGGAGDDTLSGNNGSDELYGEDGNDTLNGGSGSDTLVGGTGNDTLSGGTDNDIYLFNIGDGQDTIMESKGTDRIVFGEGITTEDIEVTRDSWNLYLTNKTSGDRIKVQDFFNSTGKQIEEIVFADGSKWSIDDLKDKARYYYGKEGNDTISGFNSYYNAPTLEDDYLYGGAGDDTLSGNNGSDELYGEDGNDTLNGGSGSDTLVGGTGNDTLSGGTDNDTYLFDLGDGQDTVMESKGTDRIVFGEGITTEDIEVTRDSWNLYLTNKTSGDRIKVQDFFDSTGEQIEEIVFADGSKWSVEDLKDKARYYYGTEGNDTISGFNSYYNAPTLEDDYLYGGAGDDTLSGNNGSDELYGEDGNDTLNGGSGSDTLVGGTGNDTLSGGTDNDTYLFDLGDGQDTVMESKGTDRIVFGEGITTEDIEVSRDSWNLYLTNKTSGDRIKVQDFFDSTGEQIEEVLFADGSKWSIEDLKDKARYYHGTEGNDTISGFNSYYNAPTLEDDYLYGGAGDDTLSGNNGSDELYGEDGNDTLNGGSGSDTLVGGTGNDTLSGGTDNDTYLFDLGDGQDTIMESKGTDRIVFGEGITTEDIEVTRDSWNLYLTNKTSGDRIKVQDFFNSTGKQIEEIEFADGSKWSIDDLKDKARYYYGKEGNDTISAQNSYYNAPTLEDDYVYGGAGNDIIYGNNGSDELYGESGNDKLYGGNGADMLAGGIGNDTLQGAADNDTYMFNLGDGQDKITESNGTDNLIFGEDINSEDLVFSKNGNDLIISIIGQEDRITISDYYYNDSYKVESFQTSDGSILDYSKIDLMIQAMASFEDTTGMMWEEAIRNQNKQANDIVNQWWTKE